jgi:hypothetical protein
MSTPERVTWRVPLERVPCVGSPKGTPGRSPGIFPAGHPGVVSGVLSHGVVLCKISTGVGRLRGSHVGRTHERIPWCGPPGRSPTGSSGDGGVEGLTWRAHLQGVPGEFPRGVPVEGSPAGILFTRWVPLVVVLWRTQEWFPLVGSTLRGPLSGSLVRGPQ